MDNFTHSLVGWTLGHTGLKRKSRKGLAALILGANMPDIDVFFGWVSWAPLATHRGVTHSLVGGVLLLPPVLAGLLWLLDRWQVKRCTQFKSGLAMHFGWLVALSYIGALTHPLLDWQNSYAVQFLSPFSNLWFHNDSLFIIDVWIWSGLAFAIWLSRRRERQGDSNWRRPAIIAAIALPLYIAGNSVITGFAKDAPGLNPPYAAPEVIFASPPPVVFYRRNLVWRQKGGIAYGDYNPLDQLYRMQSFTEPVPDGMSDPLARRAMTANADIRDFMNWSVLPTATVEREHCKARVIYGDARFSSRSLPKWIRGGAEEGEREQLSRLDREVTIPTGGTGCPPMRR